MKMGDGGQFAKLCKMAKAECEKEHTKLDGVATKDAGSAKPADAAPPHGGMGGM